MKTYKLLIWLLLWNFASTAQSGDLGNLKQQVIESKNDTAKVNGLLALSKACNALPGSALKHGESALQYARQAQQLSVRASYFKGLGLSYQEIARYMVQNHHVKQYKIYIDKAVAVFQQHGLTRLEAEAWLLEEEFYVAAGGQDVKVRIYYYDKARALFIKVGATEREAATLKILGDFYQLNGEYKKALSVLKQSLALYKTTGYRDLQGVYDLIAYVSTILGDYESGIEYGLAALKTADAVRDSTLQLCTIYNRLSLTYFHLSQYQQAAVYLKKALQIAVKFKDTSTIYQVMLNNVDVLLRLHKPAQSLNMLKLYTAKYHTNDKSYQLQVLALYVQSYVDLKRMSTAGIYLKRMFNLTFPLKPDESENDEFGVRLSAMKYYIAARQYDQARIQLAAYVKLSSKLNKALGVITGVKYSFKIDSLQGNYFEALKQYHRYSFLIDSIYNNKKTQQIEELKIRFETDKKEKDIRLLTKDGLLQREKVKRANAIRNITFAGLAVMAILIGLLYYSYRINRRNALKIGKTNAMLESLLTEKEWLIKEIHHRVKNNLQIVMGLLQRQSAYIDNEAALQAIQNSESRMHSIALIHQKLYQSENFDLISMPEYIEELTNYIKESIDAGQHIRFEKHIDDISLDVAQAVPLGLILNEAITNSVKYAYPNGECGVIRVALIYRPGEHVELLIEDDGRGLKDDFNLKTVNSLGMNLMKGLSKQIGASFEIANETGVKIRIVFKIERFASATHNHTTT